MYVMSNQGEKVINLSFESRIQFRQRGQVACRFFMISKKEEEREIAVSP